MSVSPAPATLTRSLDEVARAPRRPSIGIDWLLLFAVCGLVACSLITIHGATRHDVPGQEYFYVIRQAMYAGVGTVIALALSRFDYSRLREMKAVLYGLLISSILLVLALGAAARGSRRWIDLPFFRVQPSELGKILLVVALSAFIVDGVRNLGDRRFTAKIMLLALLPSLLVVVQPDLGTGMVYVFVAVALLFIAGAPWRHLVAILALFAISATLVLAVAPAAGLHVLKPYQVQRLTGFVNPSKDPGNQTYQINQSLIAVGSGGKTGRGVDKSTQTGGDFLPEHHTDFIFSVVGETYGFAGAAIVLSLYALLIWRTLRILTLSKNLFGSLVAGGILAMLMFQVFVNVGMTIGIMPITGVPLPLMSFGGSSMLVTFVSLGLLQSIHVQGRVVAANKGRASVI